MVCSPHVPIMVGIAGYSPMSVRGSYNITPIDNDVNYNPRQNAVRYGMDGNPITLYDKIRSKDKDMLTDEDEETNTLGDKVTKLEDLMTYDSSIQYGLVLTENSKIKIVDPQQMELGEQVGTLYIPLEDKEEKEVVYVPNEQETDNFLIKGQGYLAVNVYSMQPKQTLASEDDQEDENLLSKKKLAELIHQELSPEHQHVLHN